MKVLILYETVYPDFIGGVELRNHEVAAALGRRGHQVTLAGYCGNLVLDQPNLHVLSLGELGSLYNRAGKRSTRQALRFAAAVARLDLSPYDIVETPNMPYIHLAPLAWKCARAGKPLLVTWHEYWGAYWKGYVGGLAAPAYRAVEWLTAQLGTAVVAVSDLTRVRLAAARRRRRGRGPDRGRGESGADLPLIPNGITVSRIQAAAGHRQGDGPPGAPGAGLGLNLGLGHGDGPPLLYAGRLLDHKRLDLALHAVKILAEQETGAAIAGPLFTIFGEGPDRPRLEALARDLGIAHRVLFRGHVASSEEVWSELGRARLALQPSAREGFGIFPLEAMAAGLPVVYCDSSESAVGELVRDGREGIAVPPDPAALAAVLARLLAPAGTAERLRLATQARTRAAEYDWDEIGLRIEALCRDLLAASRR